MTLNNENTDRFFAHPANEHFGLPLGFTAPLFTAVDVDGNPFDLQAACKQYKGVFLNFFRGSW